MGILPSAIRSIIAVLTEKHKADQTEGFSCRGIGLPTSSLRVGSRSARPKPDSGNEATKGSSWPTSMVAESWEQRVPRQR
eukprot:9201598-Pyramimonas_sp.AAC.1